MSVSNEEKKKKIAEMQRQIAANSVYDGAETPTSTDTRMLNLLRVDTLIRSMQFFIDDGKPGFDFDRNLKNFIVAYKGVANLAYGASVDKFSENVVKEAKEGINIIADFSSYENIDNISKCIPVLSSKVEEIKELFAKINNAKEEIKDFDAAKRKRGAVTKGEKDTEAEEVLTKMLERVKSKDKTAKIVGFVYGKDEIHVITESKKGKSTTMSRNSLFAPLNTPEGVSRLNNLLAEQSQKTAKKEEKKAGNEKINENIKEIENQVAKDEQRLAKLQQDLSKSICSHLQKLPAEEFLDIFVAKTEESAGYNEILSKCGNADVIKNKLTTSFSNDSKIWNYVKDCDYYNMVKSVSRAGYNKNSLIYKAMPEPLKNLLEIRDLELAGLKNPEKGSFEEMNKALEKHDFKVGLHKINVSSEEKAEEYKGKSGAQITDKILEDAQKPVGDGGLSPYKRRYMTLGLMYCLGEGTEKNDDTEMFKKYMLIYFDKKNFSAVDAIKLKEEYGWEEFKNKNIDAAKDAYQEIKETYSWETFKKTNDKTAKGIYKEFKDNAVDAEALKAGLLEGVWVDTGLSTVHHNYPRRLGAFSNNPGEMNNQPNLTVTVQWKAWDNDNHQLEHFFNMSQYDGVLPYLTKEKDEYVRKGDANGLSEVYYEKPQVKKDGKWVDLIPNDTLLITPNIVVAAPELPANVKHLALDCFKQVSIADNQENAALRGNKTKSSYRIDGLSVGSSKTHE